MSSAMTWTAPLRTCRVAGTILLGLAFVGICIYYTAHKLIQRLRRVRESRVVRITPAIDCGEPVVMPCGLIGEQEHDR